MERNYNEIITGIRNKVKQLISLYESEKEEKNKLFQAYSDINSQFILIKEK
ncbi:MAG: hypothetical protein HY738_08120, partial [Bacteroidia bacterium]|nr:hypothetical protein [Bacteroidia bacterium]